MSDGSNEELKQQLAIAISGGVKVAAWARAKNVPRSTAFRWAGEPEVRKAVQAHRRRMLDRVLGRMTRESDKAAETMFRLFRQGETDAVRLKACRAVFAEMIAVYKFSDLEYRMSEIEQTLEPPAGAANGFGSTYPPNYGHAKVSPTNP